MPVNIKDFTVPGANGAEVIDYTAWQEARLAEVDVAATQYRELPATGHKVPARIALGKVRIQKRLHEGTQEVEAEVVIDGKVVGHALDEGNGGGIWFRPSRPDAREVEQQVQDEYHALERSLDPSAWLSEESLYNDLVEEYLTAKTLTDKVKRGKRIPVLRGGLDTRLAEVGGEGLSYKAPQWLETKGTLQAILADAEGWKTKGGVSHVWNGSEWQAL